MGKDFSKDDRIALDKSDQHDVPSVNVVNDFRAVNTSAHPEIDPSKFNKQMSFHEFFKMVDDIIRERDEPIRVALTRVYSHQKFPQKIHDFFPLPSALNGYQRYREGERDDEFILHDVSSIILNSLKYTKYQYEPVVHEAPLVIRSVHAGPKDQYSKHEDHHAFLTDFREKLRVLEDTKKVPLSVAWKQLPGDVVNGHSYSAFRRGSEVGSRIRVLPIDICKAILDFYHEIPDEPFEGRSVFIQRYREEIFALKESKGVPFGAVWSALPDDMVKGNSYLSHRNGSLLASNVKTMSVDICSAILDVYKKLPDINSRVSSDEMNGPFILGDQYGVLMSSELAYSQMKFALSKSALTREDVISKFSEMTGKPEDRRLLVKKHGRDKYISRLQVAIILNIIEGNEVPKESIQLLRHYLEHNEVVEPSDKVQIPPSGLQFDKDGMLIMESEQLPVTVDLKKSFKDKSSPKPITEVKVPEMSGAFNQKNKVVTETGDCFSELNVVTNDIQHDSLVFG